MNKRNVNRPVYLARRDKFYIKGIGELKQDFLEIPIEKRENEIRYAIDLFEQIRENTINAMRCENNDPNEESFLRCIELVIDSLYAVRILIGYENLLQYDKSFLNQFLGEKINNVDQHEHSAKEVARYIMSWTQSLVSKITKRFEKLKKDNFNSLSDDDKIRYQLMLNREE